MEDKVTILNNIKMFLWIACWVVPISACCYWLEQDDKRMYTDYMESCRARQIKNDEIVSIEKCQDGFYKAYQETFGRNP